MDRCDLIIIRDDRNFGEWTEDLKCLHIVCRTHDESLAALTPDEFQNPAVVKEILDKHKEEHG